MDNWHSFDYVDTVGEGLILFLSGTIFSASPQALFGGWEELRCGWGRDGMWNLGFGKTCMYESIVRMPILRALFWGRLHSQNLRVRKAVSLWFLQQ